MCKKVTHILFHKYVNADKVRKIKKNYLYFACPIPVGRNLRNYLAHGDICIEVLCPDIKFVVEELLFTTSTKSRNKFWVFHDQMILIWLE